MYKMWKISKEAFEKSKIQIIDQGKYFWVNRRDLEIESGGYIWVQCFDKCDPNKQKYRQELMPNVIFQRC